MGGIIWFIIGFIVGMLFGTFLLQLFIANFLGGVEVLQGFVNASNVTG